MGAPGDFGGADGSVDTDAQAYVGADVFVEHTHGVVIPPSGVAQPAQPAGDHVLDYGDIPAVLGQLGLELHQFHAGVNVLLNAGHILNGSQSQLLQFSLGAFFDEYLLQIRRN